MLLAGLVISTVETAQNDRKKGLWMAGGIFALQIAYFIIGHMPPFRSLSGDILTGFLPNLAVNEYGITFILLGVAMYFLRDKPGALAAIPPFLRLSVQRAGLGHPVLHGPCSAPDPSL